MPKVKGFTQKQRETQIIDTEIQRASKDFLTAARAKRGLEDKTYTQIAEDIGVTRDTLRKWRGGKLPDASFGRVIAAYARMGYRLVPEPIQSNPRRIHDR